MAANDSLAEGKAALARGDWATARRALAEAAHSRPSGETMEALGTACWWQDDGKAVLETREAAYRLYREEGDPLGAARVATLVGVDYADYRGDFAVAGGWLQRAESILKDVALAVEHGWLHIYQGYFALMFNNDLPEAHRRLGLLRELTPRLHSVDLEMMAVGLTGLTAIREGDVERGMRYLDEAMTAATGGDMSDLAAIGNTCCSLIYACGAVADYDRAAQWCERTREFCKRFGLDQFFAICRNYYAAILIWKGEWDEAESELSAALAELQTNRPSYALESLARLGELRRRQGRLEEAAEILQRAQPHRTAVFGEAALALDRGDSETAVDLLLRLLRRVGDEDQAERVFVLELLTQAYLESGDADAAAALLPDMSTIAESIGTSPLLATVLASQGRVALARGEVEDARRRLEDAIDLFDASDAGFDAARVRLDYAAALERGGRHAAAVRQAMLAQTAFTRLGALQYREKASRLVAGISAGMTPPAAALLPYGLTPREAEVLWLIAVGKTNQDIARDLVLSVRTVERHISTVYEKLGLQGRAARASAAAIAVAFRANTQASTG
jgi:ATP/maltotriose-dependent transcriptional regulator MalT